MFWLLVSNWLCQLWFKSCFWSVKNCWSCSLVLANGLTLDRWICFILADALCKGLFLKLINNICLPLKCSNFEGCVHFDEVLNIEEPTTDPYYDLALLYLHMNLTATKSVNTFRLPHEHYLHLIPLRVRIYKLSQCHVNIIEFPWDIQTQSIF